MTRIDPGSPGSQTHDGGNGVQLPHPNLRRMRWPFPIVWIVPILAAIAAGLYGYKIFQERGPLLNITFDQADGLKTGETPVTVHGVRVGTVEAVSLSPDEHQAIVHVRLFRADAELAKKDTIFWMVKPDISGGNIIGVGAIASGPYIEAVPGHGDPATNFVGQDSPPTMMGEGMRIILHANTLGKLQIDSPVYYRGIQVGVIQDIRLSKDSTQVNATAFIWLRFTRLLYTNSQFWMLSGTDINGSLFTGLHVQLGSLRSILGGGVAFATPTDDRGALAQDGSQFDLNDEMKKEWATWAPRIDLGPDAMPDTGEAQKAQTGLQSSIRVK